MKDRFSALLLTLVAALVGLAVLSPAGGCGCDPCPEPERFESSNYEIVGLAYQHPEPESQWLLDTVIGAQLTVDRETGEATIRYTKDGTTYEVQYTIGGSQP
jgi:hypothetical protein